MTKATKFLTTVPFSGFYCYFHDSELERALESMFDRAGTGDANSDLVDAARDAIDWACVHESYAAEYVAAMRAEYGLGLAFESLTSPKYYNFETDRIFAHIDIEGLAMVARAVPRAALRKAIKERFTSRSGFISHYPACLSEWPARLSEWDHNQIGTLLSVYLDQEAGGYGCDGFDGYREQELMDPAQGNGYFEDCFFEHARRGYDGTLNRLCGIAEYLATRDARPIKTLEQWHAARRVENRPFADTPLGNATVC